ncbi:hypothetical protein FOQG_19162 [Fusarium oxysporum f. sp. raphani 54005]|uniref:Uncharacterized protein n=1 Tax=Fusarium oxysporum f. sp. raphani 54005 TaxID=1089458 RepID=X0BC44_FUSOX|nr:hypothetical protein FOQG_19162 [Fusarium oxysporum f. sp. raphani 54005]
MFSGLYGSSCFSARKKTPTALSPFTTVRQL